MSIGSRQRTPTPTEYSSGALQSLNALPVSKNTAPRMLRRKSRSNSMLATTLCSPPPPWPDEAPAFVSLAGNGGLSELSAKPRTLRSPPAKNRCEAGSSEKSSTQLVPSSARPRKYQGPWIGHTRSARP
jgi:hypothetical protein